MYETSNALHVLVGGEVKGIEMAFKTFISCEYGKRDQYQYVTSLL